MSEPATFSRRLTWKPRTPDGDMVADIVEILHELGLPDEELRQVAAHYVKNRFPEVNCTVSRANLGEFLGESLIFQPNEGADLNDGTGL